MDSPHNLSARGRQMYTLIEKYQNSPHSRRELPTHLPRKEILLQDL